MPDVVIDIVQQAARTTTGDQTVTGNLNGKTCKAVLAIATLGVTNGTAIVNMACSVGAATGPNDQFVAAVWTEDNQGDMDSGRYTHNDKLVAILDNNVVGTLAELKSLDTDGITVTFNTVDTAVLITYILFAGDDVQAKAFDVGLGTAVPATITVSGVGFEPELVFFAGSNTGMAAPTSAASLLWTFGICHNDKTADPQDQGALSFFDGDAAATSVGASSLRNAECLEEVTSLAQNYTAAAENFGADGFDLDIQGSSNPGDDRIGILALDLGGLGVQITAFDAPTATGSTERSHLPWKPQFVLMTTSTHDTEGVRETDGTGQGFGISAMTAGTQVHNSWAYEDNQNFSNTQSLCDNKAINFASHDGANLFAGTLTSFDADGHTIDYTAVDTVVTRKWFELAIEESVAAEAASQQGATDIQLVM